MPAATGTSGNGLRGQNVECENRQNNSDWDNNEYRYGYLAQKVQEIALREVVIVHVGLRYVVRFVVRDRDCSQAAKVSTTVRRLTSNQQLREVCTMK